MPKKNIEIEEVKIEDGILPVEFADLNTLKDKINEIIARING